MKQKTTFKERLKEAALEIVITLIALSIGGGLVFLFGKNPFELDLEILALIGIGILIAVILIAAPLHKHFIDKEKGKSESSSEKQIPEEK